MLTYVTTDQQLLTNIISIIDDALGLPTQYTQTWSYVRVRETDNSYYIPKPEQEIPIPFGNVATETYTTTWLPMDEDSGNV